MKINRIGINYSHTINFTLNRPTGSGDYLLLLLRSPAIITLQEKEVFAEKNSVLLFNKGTPQIYRANQTIFSNDFIHFDTDNEYEILPLPHNTILVLPSVKQVNKILKDIYFEYVSNNTSREESINLLLHLLFIKINEIAAYQPNDTKLNIYYDSLLNLRSQIHLHPEEKWTITRLSHQIKLSSSHVQRLYKSTFGVSFLADVIACKMEYAKASLSGSGDTIREIALLCGYESQEHFMRQFKQEVGMTPSQYRKKMLTIYQ